MTPPHGDQSAADGNEAEHTQPAVPLTAAHTLPHQDDPRSAGTVLTAVLQSTVSLIQNLEALARRHSQAAPIASDHVLDLTAALSGTVLDWVDRWPA